MVRHRQTHLQACRDLRTGRRHLHLIPAVMQVLNHNRYYMSDYLTKWADPGLMEYRELNVDDLPRISSYYGLRPCTSCDSSPLVSYLYKYYYNVKYCELGNAFFLSYHDENGGVYGFIPFCREEDLEYYFKLQEAYFNQILGIPLIIYAADQEGVSYLQNAGALDNYEVIGDESMRDYIYSGDDLRNLAGRKYSKKRNHLHRFLGNYEGRWEYRSLTFEDYPAIHAFLDEWMKQKRAAEMEETGINEEGSEFNPTAELDGEYRGIIGLVSSPEAYSFMKIGGIFIDQKLSAFSIGIRSASQSMAIIDVEKAYNDIDGLYQVINREFLIHEFPDVELVNREDDVGIEGLRQSKLSYYPIRFSEKYILTQQNFPA